MSRRGRQLPPPPDPAAQQHRRARRGRRPASPSASSPRSASMSVRRNARDAARAAERRVATGGVVSKSWRDRSRLPPPDQAPASPPSATRARRSESPSASSPRRRRAADARDAARAPSGVCTTGVSCQNLGERQSPPPLIRRSSTASATRASVGVAERKLAEAREQEHDARDAARAAERHSRQGCRFKDLRRGRWSPVASIGAPAPPSATRACRPASPSASSPRCASESRTATPAMRGPPSGE